jgi:hypothetical protein
MPWVDSIIDSKSQDESFLWLEVSRVSMMKNFQGLVDREMARKR